MTFIKRSEDGKVSFEEGEHRYYDKDGDYTSVTTLLKEHFEAFDADRIAKLKADNAKRRNHKKYKNNETITELDKKEATQKYWKQQWKEAAEHGTRVHNALENNINKVPQFGGLPETRDQKKYEQGILFMEWFFKEHLKAKNVKHYTEVLIYNKELMTAGQIDLMSVVDGKTYLLDWKSSRKIDMVAYKNKKGLTETTKHLADCNYTKYSLQLGIYKKLLELKGKELEDCFIIHLMEEDYQTYKIKDLKETVDDLLELRRLELIKPKEDVLSELSRKPKGLNSY